MLAERLERHGGVAWLVNTGWVGGVKKGRRCPLKYTRAIVSAIHSGELATQSYATDEYFNLSYPTACPGVPPELLNPKTSWKVRERSPSPPPVVPLALATTTRPRHSPSASASPSS